MAETHRIRQTGGTMTVRDYRGMGGPRPYAVVDIDGDQAWLVLTPHGQLDTQTRTGPAKDSGDVYQEWKAAGLTELVCRGRTADADDTALWLGPIPDQLKRLVR